MGTLATDLVERLRNTQVPLSVSIHAQFTEEQQRILESARAGTRPGLQRDFKKEVFRMLEEHIPAGVEMYTFTDNFYVGTRLTKEQIEAIANLPYVHSIR